ncbi:MAG: phosphorylase, partial [Gammaproteobacteria bacterium]|nr:phosphorylase [Gammaproteobacteria bacterium]
GFFSPVFGTIAGVGGIIERTEKHALHTRTGAVAADMESIAVARNARRRGLPMIAVRAISDGPEDALPISVLGVVDAFGRARYGALLGTLVRRPGDVAALARLRAGFSSACTTLSQVIARTGAELCCPGENDR